MNRRVFLKRGLLGGAVLAVGAGTGLALYPSKRTHAPREPLLALDEQQFAIMAAMSARFVTAEGADPIEITHVIDKALARAAPEAVKDLGDVLNLFDNALIGLLLDGQAKPFTQLDGEAQDRKLKSWRDSRLVLRRGGYKALRNLALTSFYRQDKNWAQAGYPGPPDYVLSMPAVPAINPGIEEPTAKPADAEGAR